VGFGRWLWSFLFSYNRFRRPRQTTIPRRDIMPSSCLDMYCTGSRRSVSRFLFWRDEQLFSFLMKVLFATACSRFSLMSFDSDEVTLFLPDAFFAGLCAFFAVLRIRLPGILNNHRAGPPSFFLPDQVLLLPSRRRSWSAISTS